MSTNRIRIMHPEDLKQVILLEKQIFSRPWSERSFERAVGRSDTIYLVAEWHDVIRGYLGIWCTPEEGDLCNMAVAGDARRQGVATMLLAEGLQECRRRGLERILLEVRESNTAARQLYQQQGFRAVGVRRGYYTAPSEDAVIMECRL